MSAELSGPAPGGVALVIIDMINDLNFSGGQQMRPRAEAAAEVIVGLRAAADARKVPVVYVNDNHGQWHSERSKLIAHCLREDSAGREMVQAIAPRDEDYFVIKPEFSGFYSTNLPVLLPQLSVKRLILTGVAADICVLFTAADAHMRAYDLWVPRDAIAADNDQRTQWALEIMKKSMAAETRPTTELSLDAWIEAGR